VCKNYEKLKLDIPRGDEKTTLKETIHGWIMWEKHHIILKPADQASRPASPGSLLIRHQDQHLPAI
jgi:hypothetical protein